MIVHDYVVRNKRGDELPVTNPELIALLDKMFTFSEPWLDIERKPRVEFWDQDDR